MAARGELLSLIRHAKDDPDDGPRRLVLADWLEEHGDESDRARADFLRARAGGEEAADAWRRHRDGWAAGLGPLQGEVAATDEGFLAWAGPSRFLTPKRAEQIDPESLAWLAKLRVASLVPRQMAYAAEAGLLDEAVTLDLRYQRLPDQQAAPLARLGGVLRQLLLWDCEVGSVGLKRLLAAPCVPRLRRLSLENNRLRPESGRELAGAALESLRHLGLGENPLEGGLSDLARAPWLPRLQTLDLARFRSRVRLSGLLQAGDLSSLTALSLRYSPVGPEVIEALIRSATLGRLESLDLTGVRLPLAELRRLIGSALFARLHDAYLCLAQDEQVAALAGAAMTPAFERLSLDDSLITDRGLAALAEWPSLATVKVLSMLRCRAVGPAGWRALVDSPYLGSLAVLMVSRNAVPAETLSRLDGRFHEMRD